MMSRYNNLSVYIIEGCPAIELHTRESRLYSITAWVHQPVDRDPLVNN